MQEAVCDFCGTKFKPNTESGATNYMQVLSLELRPTQFQRAITLENLFMCQDCFDRLQTNIAFNCRNFRSD